MAPAAASGGSSLPSGFSVFATFPDLLFVSEFIFGGLVWILIASSLVPIPLVQGWVMFVSVFCFVATTALLVLYIIGAHGGETSWVTLDAAYQCVAALFYLSASVLEALATISMQDGFIYKHYHENIAAVVSPACQQAHAHKQLWLCCRRGAAETAPTELRKCPEKGVLSPRHPSGQAWGAGV
ncbi:myelin and lymphocyte protein [Marmota marmota marmota]|uniref:Myelin and lymphocyte protein n=1 Tax=Marmota marmota marmota TaxID=9994 RepID=A0A8C5YN78_MARMA|nr:myelin and lymphocyte protein [Marmota marmota marmota]